MNLTFCYPTAAKDKEESMSNGFYRPYFHGELVAAYRKSIRFNGTQKPPVNDVEANNVHNHVEQVEEYVEPGIHAIFAVIQVATINVKRLHHHDKIISTEGCFSCKVFIPRLFL